VNPNRKAEADYAAFLETERKKTEMSTPLRDLDADGPGPEDRGDEAETE
jgi:hypothetical protein